MAEQSKVTTKKPVVLVIDDDENVLRSIRLVLMRKYDVHVTNDPEIGIQVLNTLRPDVVVTDIKMPGFDGFWVYAQVRAFDQNVPVIFNSAYQDAMPPEDLRDSFKPFGVVTKNGNLEAFLLLVANAAKHMSDSGV